ncbi:DUF1684 domain-containing protein [Epilithonimonas pallida]|jgi:uncharacterized protein (DUF1684 family)|uniref:DUF1684 domain-containing protein n=1 Tax=Epilithonimonas pallida TaxID=373671 RepID=A0ABY1R901_9FLAO|nr:DUF1684 domain-containing protein [Epilithonimonas pallida]SMP95632.1 hypothetical protein SAMN05421679_107190 [Epilithonimonas pallida]
MKKLSFLFIILSVFLNAQTEKENIAAIKKFQKELNAEYLNPKETPLRGNNLKQFKKHPFFPINLKYRVTAQFIRTENPVPFELPTSSGKFKQYQEYGKATFELDGQSFTLTLYQSLDLMKMEKYKDYLFLPFRDLTNEKETYGGGKYMDLKIPTGNEIVLDFNQSYQPYCAYNAFDYNCPIVPEENKLPIRIEAGVMYEDVYHH